MDDKSTLLNQLRIDRGSEPVRSGKGWIWAASLAALLVAAIAAWAWTRPATVPVHIAVAQALAGAGRSTLALDLAGHGRSDGRRAVVESVNDVLADIDRLVGEATSTSKPVLLGHSMGGAFAAAYATANPGRLSALVLSAPALHLASSPRWQALTVQALAAVVPRAGVTRIDPTGSR